LEIPVSSTRYVFAPICVLAALGFQASQAQEKSTFEQRVFAGKDLTAAREKMREHEFRDKELQDVFRIGNGSVDVIALDIRRSGPAIQEITVFRSSKADKGRFVRVRVLGNPKDEDFRAMVQRLGL
jgi:hypothetical protein